MTKWLETVIASVPRDFRVTAEMGKGPIPKGVETLGLLPEDIVPVFRALVYFRLHPKEV